MLLVSAKIIGDFLRYLYCSISIDNGGLLKVLDMLSRIDALRFYNEWGGK